MYEINDPQHHAAHSKQYIRRGNWKVWQEKLLHYIEPWENPAMLGKNLGQINVQN